MSEPSADDLTKRLFVCCGYVTLESGKPGIAIAEVMAEPVEPSDETASQFHIPGTGDLARLRIYERKLLRHFSVGSTYEMEANDKSIRPGTALAGPLPQRRGGTHMAGDGRRLRNC